MELILQNIWLVVILPLAVFFIIIFGQKYIEKIDRQISMYLTAGATFSGLIFSLIALFYLIFNPDCHLQQNFDWLTVGSLNFSMGYLIDELSVLMLCVVTSVSLLIQIYSHGYMEKDPCYHRFFAYLAFFNFSMLGLVLSSNLFQTYIFWELVGIASYLLIGFWCKKSSSAKAAQKAFLVNRIGDFGLLLGTIIFLYLSYNFWFYESEVLLGFESLKQAAEVAVVSTSGLGFFVMGFLLFMGPIAKSAQFPLHVWLPDAMEAPTPVSALIHAATMVAAGVFLVARLYPIFILSPDLMYFIAWTGAITAILGATVALVQYDIKKALAYSTCSQLGFMMLAMGVGAYSAGMFHLMTHAYFKALLFLCAGAVIHSLSHQQDMRYMGGLRQKMPVVAYTYLVGALSISGLFLSGFFSKEEILSGVLASGDKALFIIALLAASLSAFYIFRTYFLVFEGQYRGSGDVEKPSSILTVPLIIFAIPAAIFGFIFSGSFSSFITFGYYTENHFAFLPVISTILAGFSIWLAAIFYWDKKKIVDSALIKIPFGFLYKFLVEKWFIEKFYEEIVVKSYKKIAYVLNKFDRFVIDTFFDLSAMSVFAGGRILGLIQQKPLGVYVLTSVVFIVILSVFVISILKF